MYINWINILYNYIILSNDINSIYKICRIVIDIKFSPIYVRNCYYVFSISNGDVTNLKRLLKMFNWIVNCRYIKLSALKLILKFFHVIFMAGFIYIFGKSKILSRMTLTLHCCLRHSRSFTNNVCKSIDHRCREEQSRARRAFVHRAN